MPTDHKAAAIWARAEKAYEQYLDYIAAKEHKLSLSYTDLLYVSNFKGGNTTIGESPVTIRPKLLRYEQALRAAESRPEFKYTLGSLDDSEYDRVRQRIVDFVALSDSPAAKNALGRLAGRVEFPMVGGTLVG